MPADEALGAAHRAFYGRLVGWLFRYTGDLQLAQDAVAAAFESALTAWRRDGIPTSPEAWLRVAARRHAVSAARRSRHSIAVAPESFDELEADPVPVLSDERLGLLFVCTHPAIDERMHAPLMLQVVLGIDAARIASVFLVPPATMGQRLSRAKAKIRDAGIRFRIPAPDERAARVASVLQAVYAAYGMADPTTEVASERDDELRAEAIRLARLLRELAPQDADAAGLLALLLHTESRRGARIVDGRFVPLADQDTGLWSAPLRAEANALLHEASSLGAVGRFTLEAAISGAHSARAVSGVTDWSGIAALYRALLDLAPSVGARIAAGVALAEAGDLATARGLLDSVPDEMVESLQPWWLARARLCELAGEPAEARRCATRALGLTVNPAVRAYLLDRWALA